MLKLYAKISASDRGATMIEYGLIAALIAVLLIGALQLVGDSLTYTFTNVADELDTANTSGTAP